jgi:pyruvate/2-oxoglutarate dehydrogenase complex dihydrolipoamide dehydrogenase (E3) component
MPGEARAYDLIVIGGGPAGIIGAATAATFGNTVALVDSHDELGGAGAKHRKGCGSAGLIAPTPFRGASC